MSPNLALARESGDDRDVKLDKLVMVRISAEQLKAWQAAADADHRKLPDWIRLTCDAAVKPTKRRKS